MSQMSKQDWYAQGSVSEGMKRHDKQALHAVLMEFTQLNNKDIFTTMSHDQPTVSKKREKKGKSLYRQPQTTKIFIRRRSSITHGTTA